MFVVDLAGRAARVVQHEGGAELGEARDEDERPAGEEARHDEREGDAAEDRPAPAAEVGGGLLHRGVDVGERGADVEEDDRVERERLDEDDADVARLAEPVDRPAAEDGVERPVGPEHLGDADGAHEGREDERDENQRAEGLLPGELEAVREPGERNREAGGEERRAEGDAEAVEEALRVDRVAEDAEQVLGREAAVDEAPAADDLEERPEEEAPQHDGEKGEEKPGCP